jgi:hypothetical protein
LIILLFIAVFNILLKKISNVDDLWSWAIDKLSPGLRANTWYNDMQPYGLAGYLNDFSSRIVGFATIRQLRLKNGKFSKYLYFSHSGKNVFFLYVF